ncbi:MAG: hypothetical protein AAF721_20230 [Myxococcota bacterium]
MIIVTGTKRSGTSMWMQILIAAGLTPFGEAFPRKWGETIREANPGGFFESILRMGIYYRTNPHPKTGDYFFPEQVESHLVKVFIPGLVRTDRAFIGSVVATMRDWREYEASLSRLHAMEDETAAARAKERGKRPRKPPRRIPPALEWWTENFQLLRDIATRRYRVHVQSYDGLLQDPDKVIAQVVGWLGQGDAEAAAAAVKPELRTQDRPESSSVEPELAAVFDELYDTIHRGEPVSAAFLGELNEANAKLAPRFAEHQKAILLERQRRRAAAGDTTAPPEDDDDVPTW